MNGIHDMGGMHGLGPVPVEDDEALHEDWERITFAIHMLVRGQGVYNLDEFRHARERIDPAEYLEASYYENWLTSVEMLLDEHEVITEEERIARLEAFDGIVPKREDSELRRRAREMFESDRFEEIEQHDPLFDVGDEVVVKNAHPEGHTRIPGYARCATGIIRKHYGSYFLPDATAHGEERSEPCYSVEFTASELWGGHTDGDTVYIDMFESYVELA